MQHSEPAQVGGGATDFEKPNVRGMKGEKFAITWPDTFTDRGVNIGAPAGVPLGAVALVAVLEIERLEDILLCQIETQANAVMARALKPTRIADLKKRSYSFDTPKSFGSVAIERGEDVERSNGAPP